MLKYEFVYVNMFTCHQLSVSENCLCVSCCGSLAPSGTYKVQEMLQQGGWGCAQGGFTGTFTPMWLMVARKPLAK